MSTEKVEADALPEGGVALDDLNRFKDYLSDPRARIKLEETVQAEVRNLVKLLTGEQFPANTYVDDGQIFLEWLKRYEKAILPLQVKTILLSRWATNKQLPTLTGLLSRVSDICANNSGGNILWLAMRWYPISLLMYSAGITATSVENYSMLHSVLTVHSAVSSRNRSLTSNAIVLPITEAMLEIAQTNVWRCTEEYKNTRVAESEHMFRTLQPVLDDMLYLGTSFERHFDRFEILRTLTYVDLNGDAWGPVGRFAFSSYRSGNSPFQKIKEEAAMQKDRWLPVACGMFGGSYARFEKAAKMFEEAILR